MIYLTIIIIVIINNNNNNELSHWFTQYNSLECSDL